MEEHKGSSPYREYRGGLNLLTVLLEDRPQANTEYCTTALLSLVLCSNMEEVSPEIRPFKFYWINCIEWKLMLLNTRYCYEDEPSSYSALAPGTGNQSPRVRNLPHATQQQSVSYTCAQPQPSCPVLCITLHRLPHFDLDLSKALAGLNAWASLATACEEGTWVAAADGKQQWLVGTWKGPGQHSL